MTCNILLTFWGCRGSIPTPGPDTVIFGGNTSCISIEYDRYLLIFDAGTGIRALGHYLTTRADLVNLQIRIFLSHTHWDHIQGLPFFIPGTRFTIYGERKEGRLLADVLTVQMQTPFFPASMERVFEVPIQFQEVFSYQPLRIEKDITITPFRLNHPNGAVGYRICIAGVRIAYVTDHEHPIGHFAPDVLAAVRGVDVLIHDAQYSRAELTQGKQGWGHSAWEDVVNLARAAQVQQLILFHHDPSCADDRLMQRESIAQHLFPSTRIAREMMQLQL